jgi:hypothetical protein
VSRAVTTHEGPGADEGVDAEFRGAFGEPDGYWVFQRKFIDPRAAPAEARAEICRQLLGTHRKRGEFDFQSWHRSVLTAALARYPFLTPTPHPVFLPVEERFGDRPEPGGDPIGAAPAHRTPLRRREGALDRFDAFAAAPEQSFRIVHGSGGVGWTRFLKECADRLAARPDDWRQRFVRTQAESPEGPAAR